MADCPKCGFIMDDLDRECRRCHYSPEQASYTPQVVSAASPSQAPVCPQCGQALPSALARVCPSCRTVLTKGASTTTPVSAASARVPQTSYQTPAIVDESYNRTVLIAGGSLATLVLVAYLVFAFTQPKMDLKDTFGNMEMTPSTSSSSPFEQAPGNQSFSMSPPGSSGGFSTTPAPSGTTSPSFSSSDKFTRSNERLEKRGKKTFISGKVKNNTDKSYSKVTLMYSLTDSSGAQLGQAQGTVNNLGSGAEMPFEIPVSDPRATSFRYTGYMAMGG
ncbi:MAG: FxLYD domain-containing protein [Armatimonadota bacterium]